MLHFSLSLMDKLDKTKSTIFISLFWFRCLEFLLFLIWLIANSRNNDGNYSVWTNALTLKLWNEQYCIDIKNTETQDVLYKAFSSWSHTGNTKISFNLLYFLNGIIHHPFLGLYIIILWTSRWSSNSKEPGQTARMLSLVYHYTGGKDWPLRFQQNKG